jgi:hypothetical protein
VVSAHPVARTMFAFFWQPPTPGIFFIGHQWPEPFTWLENLYIYISLYIYIWFPEFPVVFFPYSNSVKVVENPFLCSGSQWKPVARWAALHRKGARLGTSQYMHHVCLKSLSLHINLLICIPCDMCSKCMTTCI